MGEANEEIRVVEAAESRVWLRGRLAQRQPGGVAAAQRQELVEGLVDEGEVVAAISRFRIAGAQAQMR